MQSLAQSTSALKPRARVSTRGVRRAVSIRAAADGYKDHGPGYSGSEDKLTLEPIKKIEGVVTLPVSKSMSNRILLLSALAEGKTKVLNLLDSDDIRFMVGALQTLGLEITEDRENNILVIVGCAGKIPVEGAELFLGNAGTAMRPLTAAVAAAPAAAAALPGGSLPLPASPPKVQRVPLLHPERPAVGPRRTRGLGQVRPGRGQGGGVD